MKRSMFVLMSLWSTAAFAHPASEVKIAYDKEAKMLSVQAVHGVRDFATHYIDELTVRVNDAPAVKTVYAFQSYAESQFVTFKYDGLNVGTVLAVYTHCSKGGVKTAEYVVR